MVAGLAACGGSGTSNPVSLPGSTAGEDSGGTDATDGNSGFNTGVTVPPGTSAPTPSSSITRFEPTDDASGNGFVASVSYDSALDEFSVDNLAFDGDGAYTRDDEVPGVNAVFPFAVYENAALTNDAVTSAPITQLLHKAIYAVSASGQSKFAIVRTGAYIDYGFGGFIYQRDGAVTLPTTGQARYTGDYMGLRDFENAGGIEYAVADMVIDIDFEDFNDGSAVKGGLRNRRVYSTAGDDITQTVIDAINTENSTSIAELPTLRIDITAGSVSANGEIIGTMSSVLQGSTGALENFETGNYYAVMSGTNANEVVGVLVVTADDARFEGVTVRETGGFILSR
jgi:hypothetical protein